jgi:hypothetical protein
MCSGISAAPLPEKGKSLMTPEDELAALKARVTELEAKAKPPEPFTPPPYQRFDPTANISMPMSTMVDMANAVPDDVVRGIVRDNRAPTGRAGVIPTSQPLSNVRGRNVAGGGTGWMKELTIRNPPGTNIADKLMDEQDRRDRHELIQREDARRRAERKLRER